MTPPPVTPLATTRVAPGSSCSAPLPTVEALLASAQHCVDCGKCVAMCPMAEMYDDFSGALSPRGFVRQLVANGLTAITPDTPERATLFPALSGCVQCRACSQICPELVDPAGLIAHTRLLADITMERCTLCGAEHMPTRARAWVQQSTSRVTGEDDACLYVCPSCRRQAYIRNNR